MRRISGTIACLAALALLTLAGTLTPVRAETITAIVPMSPLNEAPPITNLNASGMFQVTIVITRDGSGNITAATMNFTGVINFPGAVEVTGLHIHEGPAGVAGGVRFDSGISGSNSLMFPNGVGLITRDVATVDLTVLRTMLANPAGFYLNLHTRTNLSGAVRGQLTRFNETLANTVTMNTAQEVPAPTGENGTALATITVNPTRNALGQVNGGTIWFTLFFDFPSAITFRGLHIHEGPAGMTGGVIFDTGLSGNNTIVSTTGKGFINVAVPVPAPGASATAAANQIAALGRLLTNPAGFYVNIHSMNNPAGVVRAQLTGLGSVTSIAAADKYFLPTGNADATLALLPAGSLDLLSTVRINDTAVMALPDLATGRINVTVPAALLANPGVLRVQIRNSAGIYSLPVNLVVAPQTSVNTVNVVTLDAAGFNNSVAPESLAATFGTRLASQTVGATTTILPTALDGTSVYVNGIAASLFFVSAEQVNFFVPVGTPAGPASLLVVARDGTVSQGTLNVGNTAPGLFTRLANGRGAPAAVASADGGTTFNIVMSNADGTPVEIQVGNIVQLFGTGLRFKSGEVTASAGGVTAAPSFVGAQGSLIGLDQINLTIPPAMAGKGEMDLTFTMDGKTTNAVKIKVR